MAFLRTKSLGNRRFESECMRCGEPIMLWVDGNDAFAKVFDNGDIRLFCSKRYEGPRMSQEEIEKQRAR
jgi:hypothetical protein